MVITTKSVMMRPAVLVDHHSRMWCSAFPQPVEQKESDCAHTVTVCRRLPLLVCRDVGGRSAISGNKA